MGSGPSSEQRAAAASEAKNVDFQTQVARDKNVRENDQYAQIKPYAFDRLKNGLPFMHDLTDYGGAMNSQAYAPAYAAINQRYAQQADVPSGSKMQSFADLDAQKARSFDGNLAQSLFANEQAKSEAARLITGQQQIANPLGWSQAVTSGNSSIMQAPLQSPGIGGILGGIAGAGLQGIGAAGGMSKFF